MFYKVYSIHHPKTGRPEKIQVAEIPADKFEFVSEEGQRRAFLPSNPAINFYTITPGTWGRSDTETLVAHLPTGDWIIEQ